MSCPTDDQLSDYLGGSLDVAARSRIGQHLDGCDDCRQLVVAAVRAASSRPPGRGTGGVNERGAAGGERGAHGQHGDDGLDGAGELASELTPPPPPEDGALAMGSLLLPAGKVGGAPGRGHGEAFEERGSDAATPAVGVGSRLGRYVLTELLGVGGMGHVYRARDQELDRDVALKVLRPGLSGSAEILTARLLRESRLMARLSHPSVVAVYDVGRQGSLVFVAMELITGTTLSSWLRGPRRVSEILTAFVSAGRGLIAAHQAGLVHRDFKPDNVLVSFDERGRLARVVVTDLGVARAATPSPSSLPISSGSSKPGGRSITPAVLPAVPLAAPPVTLEATHLPTKLADRGEAGRGAEELSTIDGTAKLAEQLFDGVTEDGTAKKLLLSPDEAAAPPGKPAPREAREEPREPASSAPSAGPRRGDSGPGLPLHDLHAGLTAIGAAIGTPAYMAPEQLEGKPVDQRADVFAFAVALWEALWSTRPFPGRTLAEIAVAMSRPPVRGAPRGRVPLRVSRALSAALVIDPTARTPSLQPLLDAIDPARARRRTVALGLGAAALAAIGATASLAHQPTAPSSCERELALVDAAFAPRQLAALRAAVGATPASPGEAAVTELTDSARRWKAIQARHCSDDQVGMTRTCLSARRTELLGVREDLIVDPVIKGYAAHYVNLIGDPDACEQPPPGSVFSRLPTEPELREPVRRMRARLDAAEEARSRGEMEKALSEMRQLRVESEKVWPPLYAEVLYAEGATETQSGDSQRGVATLKQAAAIAEKAHHDSIVAAAWTQLVATATFTDNDIERALEYANLADAALDRIGRPPEDETLLLYYQGAALVQAERSAEGEAKLREALRLAQEFVPDRVPVVVQGLGFLYDHDGKHRQAVEMYRQAIATSTQPPGELAIYRAQLGRNLAMCGERDEALRVASRAVTDATGFLDPKNDDWTGIDGAYLLALRQLGRADEALAALPPAKARAIAISGERGAVTAVFRQLEAVLLADLGRLPAALAIISPACEALAFTADETSLDYAGCLADEAAIELRLGKIDDAFRHADKSIGVLEASFRATADVALVYQVRGEAARLRGDKERAAADFDKAVAIASTPNVDPAFVASARIARAQLVAETDRPAAIAALRDSIAVLAPAPGLWKRDLQDAQALLASLEK